MKKMLEIFYKTENCYVSNCVKTPVAIKVSIAIMDAFVVMHKYISTNLLEQKYINDMVLEHDYKIKVLQKSLNELSIKTKRNKILTDIISSITI